MGEPVENSEDQQSDGSQPRVPYVEIEVEPTPEQEEMTRRTDEAMARWIAQNAPHAVQPQQQPQYQVDEPTGVTSGGKRTWSERQRETGAAEPEDATDPAAKRRRLDEAGQPATGGDLPDSAATDSTADQYDRIAGVISSAWAFRHPNGEITYNILDGEYDAPGAEYWAEQQGLDVTIDYAETLRWHEEIERTANVIAEQEQPDRGIDTGETSGELAEPED